MHGHKHHGPFLFGRGPMRGFGHFRHHWDEGGPGAGWPFGRRSGPHGGRRFNRGDLKYVILDLLKDQPRHGYDVIRALEERFHGFYSPSPGSVYPTLQLLEDQGYVTSTTQDGKRVFSITEEGRRFLGDRSHVMNDLRERMAGAWGASANPEIRQIIGEMAQLGQLLFQQGARGGLHDPQKVQRLREVMKRTRQEIEAIFSGTTASETDEPTML